ncbi:MAG: diaminohydroxyphosphoribosylaminopyrimidine deaminase, partial [Pseudomonadales bacterium]|nr:diaminohydroxyphosphoribosylaminopyrimidine deaminase [Pseudomonadales bacterium]
INPHATSESYSIIKQIGDGTMKAGAPKWGFGVVDVRDLAEAHFQAGFTPSAKGRHIISGHNTDLFAMAQVLLPKYGRDFPLPRKAVPKWLLWLVGPIVDKNMTRRSISRNVNLPWKGDNSKGIRELGVSYRPLEDSMNDFFQQMVDNGLVRPA